MFFILGSFEKCMLRIIIFFLMEMGFYVEGVDYERRFLSFDLFGEIFS